MSYLNLVKDLTPEGRTKIQVGQVLMFDFEGSPTYLKIMRKDNKGVWAKRLDPKKFLTPEEADDTVTVERKT